jgi:hypothetical protein
MILHRWLIEIGGAWHSSVRSRFLQRIFTPEELEEVGGNPASLAALPAKEAVGRRWNGIALSVGKINLIAPTASPISG